MGEREEVGLGLDHKLCCGQRTIQSLIMASARLVSAHAPISPKPARNDTQSSAKTFFPVLGGTGQSSVLLIHKCVSHLLKPIASHFFLLQQVPSLADSDYPLTTIQLNRLVCTLYGKSLIPSDSSNLTIKHPSVCSFLCIYGCPECLGFTSQVLLCKHQNKFLCSQVKSNLQVVL